ESSSSQVPFDDLTKRYRGKKVWVVDREKIRQRVAEVVDTTLADEQSGTSARERVADAIDGLFHDTRNIASEHSPESITQMRATVAKAKAKAKKSATSDTDLAEQIGRLTGVVEQAESMIAAMSVALRNVESGNVPRRQIIAKAPSVNFEQSGVLQEIFQSNLDLRRAMSNTPSNVNETGTN
ncbi:MAG TPA: hypothetical protein VKK61_01070, partial [Tepidisphaeraceae bacterium]|nr:hypothetical protein [Tepidisphaeraceae bacterium]